MKVITRNFMLTTPTMKKTRMKSTMKMTMTMMIVLVVCQWTFVECLEESPGPNWTTPSSEESSTAENEILIFNTIRPNKHRHNKDNVYNIDSPNPNPNLHTNGRGHSHIQSLHLKLNPNSNPSSSSSSRLDRLSSKLMTSSAEESKNSRLLKFLRHFRLDFSKFDSSCLKRGGRGVPAPPVANAHVLRYTRRRKVLQPRSRYAMALYECDEGYEFPSESADRMFCSRFKWVGPTPVCLPKKPSTNDDLECQKCDQICTVDSNSDLGTSTPSSSSLYSSVSRESESESGLESQPQPADSELSFGFGGERKVVCSCYAGYEMASNGTCVDLDECQIDNGGCHGICFNKPGSFQCSCPTGFQVGPDGKNCIDRNECLLRNGHGPCQDSCVNIPGSYICSCERIKGTRLSPDKHSCEDIDECLENNFGCSHICLNTFGNAFCACPKGYTLSSSDYKTCVSDHPEPELELKSEEEEIVKEEPFTPKPEPKSGPVSFPAPENLIEPTLPPPDIFECPPGSAPDPENHQICVEHEDCSIENGGCEQVCVPSGSFRFCSCRQGYELLNETACVDLNECLMENGGCDHECVNYEGGHLCKCKDGFQLDIDKKSCKASFCTEPPPLSHSNWDCFDVSEGTPLSFSTSIIKEWDREEENFIKAFKLKPKHVHTIPSGTKCKLRCHPGHILKPPHDLGFGRIGRIQCLDGNWSPPDTFLKSPCIPATCGKLIPPKEGTLFPPESCQSENVPLNTQCLVLCSPGFYPKNGRIRTCSKGYRWFPEDSPTCIKLPPTPRPYIHCPSDLKVELKPGQSSSYVKIPQPQANMDWYRYVEADPPWAKNLEWEVPAGSTQITFTARSPLSNDTATCTFKIHVIDREAPRVKGCPTSFETRLSPGETSREVWWSEPKFTDNVKVHYVQQSHAPGTVLSKGQHHVSFIAGDAEGNKARCEFDIILTPYSSGMEDYEMSDWASFNGHHHHHQGGSSYRHMIICPNLKTGRWNLHYAYYLPPGCRYHNQGLFSKLFKQNTYRNLIPRQRRRTLSFYSPSFSTQIYNNNNNNNQRQSQQQQQHHLQNQHRH